ncbi:MAG: hypothetical protein ACRYFX_15705 [Janthinobacterium lividum]
MQKLLTATLLLVGCALQPASAQKTRQPHKTPRRAAATRQAVTDLPPTTVNEFCLNYGRYFFDLPSTCKQVTFHRFQTAGLTLTPDVDLTTELARSSALREVAYRSLYDFCASIQVAYQKPADELLFIVLYENLHMNTGPATLLAQHCQKLYQRSPSPTGGSETGQ